VHKDSGRSYHATFSPPNSYVQHCKECEETPPPSLRNMKDDLSGDPLMQVQYLFIIDVVKLYHIAC
jgi:hypothetical protein